MTYGIPFRSELTTRVGKVWRRWKYQTDLTQALRMLPYIMAKVPLQTGLPSPTLWQVRGTSITETNILQIMLGPAGGPVVAILKLPRTHDATMSLHRQAIALAALHADDRLGMWRTFLPERVAQGQIGGWLYVVEKAIYGRNASKVISNPRARERLQTAATATINALHQRTSNSVVVDQALIERWVEQPLELIGYSIPMLTGSSRHLIAITRLNVELHRALCGRTVYTSWIHGDFWPGNLLTTPGGGELVGIIDWEFAAPHELPLHDILHLLLYTRKLVRRCELGDVIQELLTGAPWDDHERALLEKVAPEFIGGAAGLRTMLALYWLRHVGSNLFQNAAYCRNRVWVTRNIEAVLQAFERLAV
jgi:Phosphotransferase enzyme family